jgi:glycosyltransferase involved in cell wall biosynthesis
MQVLFVSWRDLANPDAGGSEVVVDRLIRELETRGHTGALVCGGPVGDHPYEAVAAGGRFSQYLVAPFVARRFRSFDLLVDVSNGVPFLSPLWWRGPRLCFYHHVHAGQWRGQFARPVAAVGWFVERRVVPLLYRSTSFVAVSSSTASALRGLGVPSGRIHVVHNGIDSSLLDIPVATSEAPLFLAIGRLAPNKGVDRLLDAWEEVEPVVGGRLVIVGDGPMRAELEGRGVRGAEFLGRVTEEEKRTLLGSAWLLVHAARHEGWGLVIMEAAAQATPTLAFDVDGVRDAVVDGTTGHLAADAGRFRDAWIELARDPRRLAAMGRAARTRATTFTWQRSADELLEAARTVVDVDAGVPARR